MAKKDNNEITVRVKCSKKKLIEILEKEQFKQIKQYNTMDVFLIPNEIDIYKMNSRDILKKAILLREFKGKTRKMRITYKNKEIDECGNILSQYSLNCDVYSIDDAKELFLNIGYKEIMKINEKHLVYEKNNIKIIIKLINKDNILIEMETNEHFKTIDELKNVINNTTIPFDKSNYFVKKAEEELDKIKNNK